jgi:hypothetical protein
MPPARARIGQTVSQLHVGKIVHTKGVLDVTEDSVFGQSGKFRFCRGNQFLGESGARDSLPTSHASCPPPSEHLTFVCDFR